MQRRIEIDKILEAFASALDPIAMRIWNPSRTGRNWHRRQLTAAAEALRPLRKLPFFSCACVPE